MKVKIIELPKPRLDSDVSVEKALNQRRSTREFSDRPLEISHVAQLLWAAQGVTSPELQRTAPSAGALYGLELYTIAVSVIGIAPGCYRYEPLRHHLECTLEGALQHQLSRTALDQSAIAQAAAIFVLSGVYERVKRKYGQRGVRYTHLEAGHAAQNLLLQAAALDLGAVAIGAFDDMDVKHLLGLTPQEVPLYLLSVGHL